MMKVTIPSSLADDFKKIEFPPKPEATERDAGDGQALISDLYEYLGRFVAYPSVHAHVAHALWCVHAHKMDAWDTTPRLAFLSPEPASGKTRALEITENLVPNAVLAVNVSPAYLFRKVGSEDRVTLLYDEIDTVFGPKAKENEEIRGLLNAGHRRGAVTGRCVMHGKVAETQEIPAYAAAALAGLGWLPDTILSRSIIIRMKRRTPGQVVEPYRRRLHAGHGEAIRDRLTKWAVSTDFTLPDDLPIEIQDRDADIWESIIAVADAIGGEWPKRARDAAVALVTASKDIEPSLGIKLLGDIRSIFTGRDIMASKDLVAELVKIEESPWADLHGRELDQLGLAKRLREYEIKSRVHRIGSTTVRGYRKLDFLDAWASYLPPLPGGSVTSVTSQCPPREHRGPDVTPVTDVTVLPDRKGDNLAGLGAADDLDLPPFLDRRGRAADRDDDPANWSAARLEAIMPENSLLDERICAQCGGGPSTCPASDLPTVEIVNPDGGTVWVHEECRRFWQVEQQ